MSARVARLLRSPALHFAAIGALAFAIVRPDAGDAGDAEREPIRPPIVIDAAQVERLVASAQRDAGRAVSGDDARAIVERAIEDEILFREGLVHGLDQGDRGVEWRLVEKMTFLSDHEDGGDPDLLVRANGLGLAEDDPIVRRIVIEKMRIALRHEGARRAPTDAELTEYLERHRERFTRSARVVLSQAVLTAERHRGDLAGEAAALAAALRRDALSGADAVKRSDPVAFPALAWSLEEAQVAARFGAAFARAIADLPTGTWSDPIETALGMHVVRVEQREPARLPALDAIRNRLALGLLAERREASLRSGIARLRRLWDVRVEWPVRLASVETTR